MKAITPFSISAPGFLGLNTQESSVDLSPNYALIANNCIIDKSGRIASRKGWTKATTNTNTQLSTSNLTCIGEVIENSGTATIVSTGGGYFFKSVTTTLTTLTYGGGGVDPTPVASNNWQFCQLNGIGMFWQRGFDPIIYDSAVSTTTFRRLNEKSGSLGTVQQANTAISAFGRVWCADLTANKNTVYWSDILTPHIWTGGTSGSLNLIGVWPDGGDEIVTLASHNNFLIIFGRHQILIYSGADDPFNMKLSDSVVGIGCIARDSVQTVGEDVFFLSDSGVRSLMRTIQEKSAPIRTVSKNINEDLKLEITAETLADIKSGYSEVNGFYLLTMPASMKTYCFDTRQSLEDGSCRVTSWSYVPKCIFETKGRKLYFGNSTYIGEYSGYLDNASTYNMAYYTTWIDFGNPIQTSILKKIILTMVGSGTQAITFKWAYDFNESYFSESASITGVTVAMYGTAVYGTSVYGAAVNINKVGVAGSSSGQVLQFGFETVINNSQVSIQKIDLYTKDGRL